MLQTATEAKKQNLHERKIKEKKDILPRKRKNTSIGKLKMLRQKKHKQKNQKNKKTKRGVDLTSQQEICHDQRSVAEIKNKKKGLVPSDNWMTDHTTKNKSGNDTNT
ncbi:hypothetical protein ACFFYR_06140 [Paraburkholderia dipogonis]|uniref:hypothetical protein n=1 Tax=Paraburkholderia dipogonis TaxID=1211383 RepID=UPI0035E7AB92